MLRGETDFNGRTVRYVHDAAGQLVERINGAGEATRYVRDAAGRAVEWHDGDSVTYLEYDPTDRLTRAVTADTELLLEHDAFGRAVRQTVNGRTLTNTYDQHVRPARPPDRAPHPERRGEHLGVGHGDASHGPARPRPTHDVRIRRGRAETERALDAGLVRIRQEWDSNPRLASPCLASRTVSRSGSSDGPGTLVARRTYAAGGRGFTLDAMGRVTAVSAEGWTERYAYDSLGNVVVGQWDTGLPGDSGPMERRGPARRGTHARRDPLEVSVRPLGAPYGEARDGRGRHGRARSSAGRTSSGTVRPRPS
ncbi:RHS repeat domain-containing protein [Streptomyces sp. CBMA29]|uniref:RHS repeat domain-containing protein n=1 Tax=Streptomyces sp. CBMA29 TaxID=1896314 RepID=UPI002948BEC5|nr:RHS repeat domain-containing protein [Streptomyces sp. CBMA29]